MIWLRTRNAHQRSSFLKILSPRAMKQTYRRFNIERITYLCIYWETTLSLWWIYKCMGWFNIPVKRMIRILAIFTTCSPTPPPNHIFHQIRAGIAGAITHTIHGTGIFTYIYHKNQLNVGKYTIHGSYGLYITNPKLMHFFFGEGEGPSTLPSSCRCWISPWVQRRSWCPHLFCPQTPQWSETNCTVLETTSLGMNRGWVEYIRSVWYKYQYSQLQSTP